MRKVLVLVALMACFTVSVAVALAQPESAKNTCATIQSGTIVATDGSPVVIGFDKWGYNYQAHMFNGLYCDSYRDASWCQPNKDVKLEMKWNDAWISNVDCNGDHELDRNFQYTSYIGSGAWLTNRQSGSYEGSDGSVCKWNYFTKLVAAPADATLTGNVWYAADGTEIGPAIWGEFAQIQTISNDSCAGEHGKQYVSPDHAGFGGW